MKAALIWRYSTTGGVPVRSLIVAMVVGTVLNLINQGDALIDGGRVSWLKLAMTYVVPYFVSTYGAVSYRLAAERSATEQLSRHSADATRHLSREELQLPQ
jgi:hypothetical protein